MARQWSARCYGVARQREGSRQNSIGGSGVLSLRHFGLVLFIPWRVGGRTSWRGEGWFRPARCCSTGSGRLDLDLDLMISGPRAWLFHQPYARAGAAGQAVVCPLLRGSSPTRGVAPKQHRGLGRAFTPAFRAGPLSLNPWRVGAWVPKNLPRRRMVSAGAMLLDRLGPPGS